MSKVQFKVGDRVLIKRAFEGNDEVVGTYGSVVWVSPYKSVFVEHDMELKIMHDCGGYAANYHGWNYTDDPQEYLELVTAEPDVSKVSLGDFL